MDPGTTKNDKGRTFPFTDALRVLLTEQQTAHDNESYRAGSALRFQSARPRDQELPEALGVGRRARTDSARLRRTAVRNLVRAGVPEVIAMRLTGHKTRSVFDCYNIVSSNDLRDAVRRLTERGTALETVIAGSNERAKAANASQEERPIDSEKIAFSRPA